MPTSSSTPESSTPRKLKLLVSSAVYGYEDLLESVFALLETFGYEVLMSHKGTVPVDPGFSAMDNCIKAVEGCDIFLGLILPRYGSGAEERGGMTITHREILHAIKVNKPRWFLVHEHVAIARELLKPYRDRTKTDGFQLLPGMPFAETSILSDLRVLDMYEAAMRHDIKKVADRTGNWVQVFGPDTDARLFATAQFRRHRDLLDKYLKQLADVAAIRAQVEKEKSR
jgi:hypothetical protein